MRHRLLAAYVVLGLGAMVWPGYAWLGNRVEPRIAGVPFSLVWIVAWVGLTFVVLALYHRAGHSDRRRG